MTARIPLRSRDGSVRAHAMIDSIDFAWASAHRWHLNRAGYVVRSEWYGARRQKCRTVYLHREVLARMGHAAAPEGDHRDRNKLNCSRSNLRPATRTLNNQNRGGRGIGGYRGVTPHLKRFRAHATVDGKRYHLGVYGTAEEAARVADRFRLAHMPGALPAFLDHSDERVAA